MAVRDVAHAEQRLDVLSLLDRTEVLVGREAIDEGRRRAVVHGWRAEHWLNYVEGSLLKYAMATGDELATVEMCGGDYEEDLLAHLLAAHEVRRLVDAGATGLRVRARRRHPDAATAVRQTTRSGRGGSERSRPSKLRTPSR